MTFSTGRRESSLTEEQLAADQLVAKTYAREMTKEHKLHMGDLAQKIDLKWAAVDALPTKELRAAAKIVDQTSFPAYRQMMTWTPPIPNYKKTDYSDLN